jgi:hypothetical protein
MKLFIESGHPLARSLIFLANSFLLAFYDTWLFDPNTMFQTVLDFLAENNNLVAIK